MGIPANKFKSTSSVKAETSGEVDKIDAQQILNEFIKAPAFSLAYLYFISICYHWGYWNGFDIDIFNFYGVQDLVKGATYGMPVTIIFLLTISAPISLVHFLTQGNFRDDFLSWVANNRVLYLFVSIVLPVGSLIIAFSAKDNSESLRKLTSSIIPNVDDELLPKAYSVLALVIIFSSVVTFIFRKKFTKQNLFKDRISKTFIYSFAVVLPPISYLSGLNNDVLIRRGVEFDYIIKEKLLDNNYAYKFLGKAGDYYFLSTMDGKKSVVVRTDSIQPLVINHFYFRDSISVKYFLKECDKINLLNKGNILDRNTKEKSKQVKDSTRVKNVNLDTVKTAKPHPKAKL
jgi:hypothetical protein